MQFSRRLHEEIFQGNITCTVRIWKKPRVKVGGSYILPPGRVVVDTIRQITVEHITPQLARQSGFEGVIDLIRTAKHGNGENVYLITFHYQEPEQQSPLESPSPTTAPYFAGNASTSPFNEPI